MRFYFSLRYFIKQNLISVEPLVMCLFFQPSQLTPLYLEQLSLTIRYLSTNQGLVFYFVSELFSVLAFLIQNGKKIVSPIMQSLLHHSAILLESSLLALSIYCFSNLFVQSFSFSQRFEIENNLKFLNHSVNLANVVTMLRFALQNDSSHYVNPNFIHKPKSKLSPYMPLYFPSIAARVTFQLLDHSALREYWETTLHAITLTPPATVAHSSAVQTEFCLKRPFYLHGLPSSRSKLALNLHVNPVSGPSLMNMLYELYFANQTFFQLRSEILAPHLQERYCVSRTDYSDFSCLDGIRILRERVNDYYCDCADGSDEWGTNACLNNRFFCKVGLSKLGYPSIPSSMVRDSIEDCADGSDELDEKSFKAAADSEWLFKMAMPL